MPDCLLALIFFDEGVLTSEQLFFINERRTNTGNGFLTVVLDEAMLPFETIAAVLAGHTQTESCDLTGLALDTDTAKALGYFYAEKYTALPVKREENRLWVAMRDPLCERTLNSLSDLTGLAIEPMLAREEEIRFLINRVFGSEQIDSIASQFVRDESVQNNAAPDEELTALLRGAPAVRLIDSLIESAILNRASDIHIEPLESQLRARFRIDGQLKTYQQIDKSMLPIIISRLKVMGGLNIAEKRLPQDGRFGMTLHGETVDFRLSTLPTLFGEKAVIRLLYDRSTRLRKDELGFFPEDLETLTRLFNSPYGAVFMTGPTGSGKSTTLSSFLEDLNTDEVNIVSVEDPVEQPLPGVNHVNIEPAAGFGFANALRHILRQDPDIIMIGEIRDEETARIAIQAAITGHLVLCTLHANDAAGVLERLLDMGVEPYLAAAAINGIISQRLVRRICLSCKVPVTLSQSEALSLQIPPDTPAYKGEGCGRCGYTGYKGRLAVYEFIVLDEVLRRQIAIGTAGIANVLRQQGTGLRENGVHNIRCGHTTVSEIVRILNR